jgi:hypothetical protein
MAEILQRTYRQAKDVQGGRVRRAAPFLPQRHSQPRTPGPGGGLRRNRQGAFIKVWVERELRRKKQRQNLFTVDWLDSQIGENPLQELFRQTRDAYRDDRIFDQRERLNLKLATGREIVRLLERYNLSDMSALVEGDMRTGKARAEVEAMILGQKPVE